MTVDFEIDNKTLSLNVNSNKPLLLIIEEDIGSKSLKYRCKNHDCGLCVVLVDGRARLSCSIPAFELIGKKVITFDEFEKSDNMTDIAKAYEITGNKPCPICYGARSLIIESLLNDNETDPDNIVRMMSAVSCSCLLPESLLALYRKATEIRRKRNVRRT